jgi:Arc/MetJ-type ribon-helix-helix transcriptional regulator
MRPKIPPPLADRIEDIHTDAGYATESEFVRDAVRRLLDQVEEDTRTANENHTFDLEYELYHAESDSSKKYPNIRIRPENATISKETQGDKQKLLNTDKKTIEDSYLKTRLEGLDIVHTCLLRCAEDQENDGWIHVVIEDEQVDDDNVDQEVLSICNAVEEAIETADSYENPAQSLENALQKYTGE